MWIGTAKDLYSFDGYNLTRCDETVDSIYKLSDFSVLDIAEDKSGQLKVGTNNSLDILDLEKQRNFVILPEEDKNHKSKGFLIIDSF